MDLANMGESKLALRSEASVCRNAADVRGNSGSAAGALRRSSPRLDYSGLQSEARAQCERVHPVLASAGLTGCSHVCIATRERDLARRIESVSCRNRSALREARSGTGAEELDGLSAEPEVGVSVPSQLTANPATATHLAQRVSAWREVSVGRRGIIAVLSRPDGNAPLSIVGPAERRREGSASVVTRAPCEARSTRSAGYCESGWQGKFQVARILGAHHTIRDQERGFVEGGARGADAQLESMAQVPRYLQPAAADRRRPGRRDDQCRRMVHTTSARAHLPSARLPAREDSDPVHP